MSEPRGICSVCGYSWRLTKAGVIGQHQLWAGFEPMGPCQGAWLPPKIESPAPVVAEVRRAPLDLKPYHDKMNMEHLQFRRSEVSDLLAEVARLTAERDEFAAQYKTGVELLRRWTLRAEQSDADLAALRTRLRGLEQQWRERGLICCPETKQPRAGWSQQAAQGQEKAQASTGKITAVSRRALSALAETPVGADNVLIGGVAEAPHHGSRSFALGLAGKATERRGDAALRFYGGNHAGGAVRRAWKPRPSSSSTLQSLSILLGKVGKGPEDQSDVLYVRNAVRIARLIVAEIERTEPTTPEEP